MDERGRRLALNEAFFREVNERINDTARAWDDDANGRSDYICECSNVDCDFKVPLSLHDYETIRRSGGARFVVAPEHAMPEIEDVIEKHGAYWVVQKRGDTGEYVALLDPRAANGDG